MVLFLQQTWLIWWALFIVIAVRWFHVVSVVNEDWESTTEFVFDRQPNPQLISRPLANN